MVRKQNERTLLLQYRIIPLSLPTKTLFLILAPRPLSTRLGAFLFPETFSHKFFPKFFPIRPRRLFSTFLARKIVFSWGELFSTFLVRKIMGVEGSCRSLNGGVSLFYAPSPLYLGAPFCPPALLPSMQIFRQSGQIFGKNGQKLDFIWCGLVFSREFGRPQRAKY